MAGARRSGEAPVIMATDADAASTSIRLGEEAARKIAEAAERNAAAEKPQSPSSYGAPFEGALRPAPDHTRSKLREQPKPAVDPSYRDVPRWR